MAIAGRGAEQIALRLPLGMRDLIKVAADENGRSVNSEIIFQLKRIYSAEAAAGGEFGDQAPAALNNNAALAGGASINPVFEVPR